MDRIKERQKLSWQGMFYGMQRIDLLIVSISGAGIYVCLETIKYLKDNNMCDSLIIKLSAFILLLSIGLNFLSQIYGKQSNYYDYLWCEEKLNAGNKPNKDQKRAIDKYDSLAEKHNNITSLWTNISTICMVIGFVGILSYFLFIL